MIKQKKHHNTKPKKSDHDTKIEKNNETKKRKIKINLQHLTLGLYGFGGLLFPPLFIALLWISIIASPETLLAELRSPRKNIARASLALCTLVLLELAVNSQNQSHPISDRLFDAQKWIILFIGYIPLSNWLRGDCSRIFILLGSALAGMISGLFIKSSIPDIFLFRIHGQEGFLIKPAISSMLSVMTLSGIILFRRRISEWGDHKYNTIKIAICSIFGYLSTYILISSQYRTSLISFLIAIPILFFFKKNRKPIIKPQDKLVIYAILSLMAAGISLNIDTILERVSPDLQVISAISKKRTDRLDLVNPGESSMGYRIEAAKAAIKTWGQHPILGWGPISSAIMISNSKQPSLQIGPTGKWLSHFHCGYLEILIRFGVIGTALILLSIISIWRESGKILRNTKYPEDIHTFIALGLFAMIPWGATGIYTLPNAITYMTLFISIGTTILNPDRRDELTN